MATKKSSTKPGPFAVIATGGKQYRVSKGDVISIEKIKGDAKAGDAITFDSVLLTDNGTETVVGAPTVAGVKVSGKITEIGRGKKISVIKYKAKSRYFKHRGHRQPFFKVEITGIK